MTDRPQTGLPHTRLGALDVPRMGLGCMGMTMVYGRGDPAGGVATIRHALDRGVTLLDTADMYANGANEELVARAIAGRRDEAIIATKCGITTLPVVGLPRGVKGDPAYIRTSAEASPRRLGTDVIEDYSTADGDTFGLSDADFGFGDSGTLTDGTNYFESETATLSAAPLDASGGTAGPAVVILGDGSGTDGVVVYYTDDASAMTTNNSYQIADINGTNTSDIEAGDFNLRA